MKIFIGLTEIAGYYTNLEKGFRQIGISCDFINLTHNPYRYDERDSQNILVRCIRGIYKQRTLKSQSNIIKKILWYGIERLLCIPLFIMAILKYDVFIFGFTTSFFNFIDLPILKFLNKKIIYVFHGSDSRPPYINGAVMTKNRKNDISECLLLTKKRRKIIRTIDKYADIIIDHPPMGLFHERPFVLVLSIGIPYNSPENPITGLGDNPDTVCILHSPSHLEAKGTHIIRDTISNLKSKGYNIEFVEIMGKPNSVVLEEVARCDFVVDQLYSDTPLAGFATEAAFFGKPAVVGGYYAEYIYDDYSEDDIPPSYYCHPDDIEKAIEKMITDKEFRLGLGKKASDFVKTQWHPAKVAERYLRIILDDIPEEWLYDPQRISYIYGAGISKERAKQLVKALIEKYGKEVLQLNDKPELEKKFIEFSQNHSA